MQQCQTLLVNTLKERLSTVFQRNSGSQLEKETMSILDTLEDPFDSLSTTHMRKSALNEHFLVVKPEEVRIGQKACRLKRKGSSALVINDISFHYIPLVKSLEQFLSHPKILSMIDDVPQNCRDGFLYDIVDGDMGIILYTDEIEMCNPLGSCATKNKLLMVYYTLGNINPKYRSKLSAIRLLAIAKSKDLSECGLDAVLQRIQEDLVQLYNGVQIQTVNGEREIFGAVVSVCGDTLAQHELCGFKEGVGFAYSKCRHCECSFEDMQNYFNEDAFVKRTLDKHIKQCNEIEKASTDFLRNNLRTTYGINRKSNLVNFPGFDLIKQTPQDVMHVILEGIAQLEVKCVLKHLVLSGQIDLDTFNSAILGFPYALTDVRDKPCPITYTTLASNDNKIKQSSGQMLVLLRILPFLFGAVQKNQFVKFLLELIEIVQIIFAPVISLYTVSNLKVLIEQHLKHMKELFPEINITPKHHYLIHIPSQIKMLGPMVRNMCMRFESKHCFFKKWASKLNFKNICKSLVNHSQIEECCQNTSHHPIFNNEQELGPASEVKNMTYLQEKCKSFIGVEGIEHAVSVKWLILNGNKYVHNNSLIITRVTEDGMPVFGLVQNIFIVNSTLCCFEIQPYNTVCFDKDFMSYKVEVPYLAQANELVTVDNLVDFTSYCTFCNNENMYVPVKYSLTDTIRLYKASNNS